VNLRGEGFHVIKSKTLWLLKENKNERSETEGRARMEKRGNRLSRVIKSGK